MERRAVFPTFRAHSRHVMAGQSRSKNGVASLAYVPAIHAVQPPPPLGNCSHVSA
jgi:hypothetical protein